MVSFREVLSLAFGRELSGKVTPRASDVREMTQPNREVDTSATKVFFILYYQKLKKC